MIGKLYIDGYDAYAAFGVFVVEGGYDSLVAFPPMKSIESNNWAEEDGEEFDLSAPTLRSREIGRASVGKECRSRWSPYH